jgi:hypothetical protein
MKRSDDTPTKTRTVISRGREITVPVFEPPTPEEIERRRQVVERIIERRERIGPIGITAEELLREAECPDPE